MIILKATDLYLPEGMFGSKSLNNRSLVRDKIYGELHYKINSTLYIKNDCNLNITLHSRVWESIELPILRRVWRQFRNQICDAADDKIKKKFETK